ncbi:unnamed protein product [Peronospora belbahrii]|uniref:BZIP domain-containing protein n=1 Tax=Peronospora belbahrii TaxID=622444 RepID=A0AAU9KLH0_9STRA|nr:unnamed protein product [Peronospora belbahrii]
MSTNDRRMDIMTLCSTEEPVSLDYHVADSPLPRDASIRRTGSSRKQNLDAVANISTVKFSLQKRSRRLSNSERGKLYRWRRKNYVQTLEEQVEQLKQEVDQLYLSSSSRNQRAVAWSLPRQPMGSSFASVVNEYFSLFRYGVPVAEQNDIKAVPQDQLLLLSRQVGFLNGLMHPDVVFGDSHGVHELLDQWRKYSLYHAGLIYEIKSLQIMATDPNFVVVAPATLYVRFTRRTVEKIFPHVLWNEAFVQRLIGKEFAYPVRNTFYFGDDNKIHRYDTYVDFVATFMSVLGNIEDSMIMMENALIRQESMIGDLLEEPHSFKAEMQGVELAPLVQMVDTDCHRSNKGPKLTPIELLLHS